MVLYDAIGATYTTTRRPDPRIRERIHTALGDARSVINVGAGTGSYEPSQTVLAIEPSPVMISQRPAASAPVVQARAEALPVADDAADAAMAVLTVHHWADLKAGVAELRRVARRRVVVLTWDQRVTREFWLLSEYLPAAAAFEDHRAVPVDHLAALLGGPRIEPVPVPHDCTDGFGPAYWRRPTAYLDPVVRAGMSMLAQHSNEMLRPGLDRLAADLESGRWHKRHADLLHQEDFDAGYRLLIAEQQPGETSIWAPLTRRPTARTQHTLIDIVQRPGAPLAADHYLLAVARLRSSVRFASMSPTHTDLLPDTRRSLRHRLATSQVQGRAPSVVAAVVRDGRPLWIDGWGYVNGELPHGNLQYRIGSITKTFVALLVMRLRDEGRLALTDPLSKHLPGTVAGQATVGALLAHTAGLVAEAPGPWWERTPGTLRPDLADVLGSDPQLHPAGHRHHYSNPGYALLGALIERIRGETWGEVLRREVLEPLGMSRTSLLPVAPHATGWAVHPWADVLLPEPTEDTGQMAPAGQLWSTAKDLATFVAFLIEGDERVLHPDTIAEMREPASPPEATRWDSGYGLGMQLLRRDGRLLAGHTGSMPGFVATVWVSADDGLGAVVLANVTAGLAAGAVAADLLHAVAEREPRIPAPWRPLPAADPDLLDLAGPWYWGPAPYVLRPLANGVLELTPMSGGGRGTRLRPTGDGGWEGTNGYFAGERLQVERDTAGAVSHLDLGTFVFTRQPYDPAAPVPGGVDPAGWRAG